jgi:hypothetical protein
MAPPRLSLPARIAKLKSQPSTISNEESNITDGINLPWKEVPNAELHLLPELKKMYWSGVKRELGDMLFTLNEWQLKKYETVILDDETDDFVHGFDTFVRHSFVVLCLSLLVADAVYLPGGSSKR